MLCLYELNGGRILAFIAYHSILVLVAPVVKNLPVKGSIPGLGRAPGEGSGNPLQYSCLGNHMDRGAWQASVGSQRVRYDLATQQQ